MLLMIVSRLVGKMLKERSPAVKACRPFPFVNVAAVAGPPLPQLLGEVVVLHDATCILQGVAFGILPLG